MDFWCLGARRCLDQVLHIDMQETVMGLFRVLLEEDFGGVVGFVVDFSPFKRFLSLRC